MAAGFWNEKTLCEDALRISVMLSCVLGGSTFFGFESPVDFELGKVEESLGLLLEASLGAFGQRQRVGEGRIWRGVEERGGGGRGEEG